MQLYETHCQNADPNVLVDGILDSRKAINGNRGHLLVHPRDADPVVLHTVVT